ncbi:UV-damaged DNA-binding protein rad7 [Blastocladiella emersonii ATCC 22665]|nr:UV-damaged DNA-binding protein rad7 [Blastocladiella emersonii ATCC 22665]
MTWYKFSLVRDDADVALAALQVPSLVDTCIKKIVDLIDDVESLGDLSKNALRKFARVVCKKRMLNAGPLPLFTGDHVTSLTLFDVTLTDRLAAIT